VRLSIKIRFDDASALGPGKVRLLELIRETGSISAAGRELGMAYSRAWNLINDVNGMFERPLVVAQPGGRRGGTAEVTPLGLEVIARYRALERELSERAATELSALERIVCRSKRKTTKQ
jgi:molybdate transport system regulatory protein